MQNPWCGPASVQILVIPHKNLAKFHYHCHCHQKPITIAVTPSHILYHKQYKNTSTLTTHNQQNVYFISRSENIQFGHGSTQGTLRGRNIKDSITPVDGLRCV